MVKLRRSAKAVAPKTRHDAYPVRTAAQLTGLSADLIRVWEKRYSVVKPVRGPRGARLYSAADVARLRALAAAVAAGRSIGDIAHLDSHDLQALNTPVPAAEASQRDGSAPSHRVVATILECVQQLDGLGADRHLSDAWLALGNNAFLHEVVEPLLHEVGEAWVRGEVSIAQEHLVSGIVRNLITGMLRARPILHQPAVLLATPPGERHELGLLLAALVAHDCGVGVGYLGIDLPAAEIAAAATSRGCPVVALSVVGPANRGSAVDAVRELDRSLAPATEIWLGGGDAADVCREVRTTRARRIADLGIFAHEIERFRFLANERHRRPPTLGATE